MSEPQPSVAPEVAFEAIIAQLHRRWRLVVCAPLVYLLVGVVIWKRVFAPRGGDGLLPPGDLLLAVLLVLSGLGVALLWRLMERMRLRVLVSIDEGSTSEARFRALASSGQFQLYTICDLMAAPGIALFLIHGEVMLLLVFVVTSMVAFLRVMPSDKLLGEIFFRRLHAS